MRVKIICIVLLLLFTAIVIPQKISAEIISVSHTPDVVYSTDVVEVSAVLTGSDSLVALHWQVDGGTANTDNMTNSSSQQVFVATIPAQTIGSTVDYWVTSENGSVYDRSPSTGTYSYYVYSPDTPDLVINEDSIIFTPLDPTNPPYMTETNVTNIFITVRNIGQGGVSNIRVRVYDRDVPIWNGRIISLAGDGNLDTIRFDWRPLEGHHILRFDVDPDNDILETDEDNNDYSTGAITIRPQPPQPPITKPPEDDITSLMPYILIPVIFLVLLLLFLRRKTGIKVSVFKIKKFTSARSRETRYKYTCGYFTEVIVMPAGVYGDEVEEERVEQKQHVLGETKSTDIKVDVGDTLRVKPIDLVQKEDGSIVWADAEVLKFLPEEEPDAIENIRKLVKKRKE